MNSRAQLLFTMHIHNKFSSLPDTWYIPENSRKGWQVRVQEQEKPVKALHKFCTLHSHGAGVSEGPHPLYRTHKVHNICLSCSCGFPFSRSSQHCACAENDITAKSDGVLPPGDPSGKFLPVPISSWQFCSSKH